MENKTLSIYEKLSAITNELTIVAKNLQVGEGKFAYKAVGEADILAAIRPLEAKYKVYSYPFKREIVESGTIENTNFKGELKKNLFLRIETIYRFVNIENSFEYVDITTYGDGVDSQDKAVGKAMTYSDKYGLMKAYKIMTGDDPDQNISGDLKNFEKKPTSKLEPKEAVNPEPNYRPMLIEYCKCTGLDMTSIAKEYKLNAKSTNQDFLNVLKALGVEVK